MANNKSNNSVDVKGDFWWDELQSRIMGHTVSICAFKINPDGTPKLGSFFQGSGVLVKWGGACTLATCSHNFDRLGRNYKFAVMNKNGFKGFRLGDFYTEQDVSRKSWKGSLRDDVAFVRLKDDFIRENHGSFFSVSKLPARIDNACSTVACGLPGGSTVTLDGFPLNIKLTSVCVFGELRTDIEWAPDGTPAIQNVFHSVREDQLSAYTDGKEIWDAPDSFRGISGGGLWSIVSGKQLTLLGLIAEEDSTRFRSVSINRWIEFFDSA